MLLSHTLEDAMPQGLHVSHPMEGSLPGMVPSGPASLIPQDWWGTAMQGEPTLNTQNNNAQIAAFARQFGTYDEADGAVGEEAGPVDPSVKKPPPEVPQTVPQTALANWASQFVNQPVWLNNTMNQAPEHYGDALAAIVGQPGTGGEAMADGETVSLPILPSQEPPDIVQEETLTAVEALHSIVDATRYDKTQEARMTVLGHALQERLTPHSAR